MRAVRPWPILSSILMWPIFIKVPFHFKILLIYDPRGESREEIFVLRSNSVNTLSQVPQHMMLILELPRTVQWHKSGEGREWRGFMLVPALCCHNQLERHLCRYQWPGVIWSSVRGHWRLHRSSFEHQQTGLRNKNTINKPVFIQLGERGELEPLWATLGLFMTGPC